MTIPVPAAETASRGEASLGIWSLITAVGVLLWVLLTLLFGFLANTSVVAGNVTFWMSIAGFVVVPVEFITAIVLAVLAFTRNGPLGKKLARIALLLLLVFFVLGVVFLVFGSGLFSFFLSAI